MILVVIRKEGWGPVAVCFFSFSWGIKMGFLNFYLSIYSIY